MGAGITDAMIKRQIFPRVVVVGLALSLSACTNPYDPVQRTIGGGLIGAGSGAAIGAAASTPAPRRLSGDVTAFMSSLFICVVMPRGRTTNISMQVILR